MLETANPIDDGSAAQVQSFAIGSNGALTAISNVNAGIGDLGDVVADPAGKYVFAGTGTLTTQGQGNTQIFSYQIGSSGALAVADTTNVPHYDQLQSLLVDSSGTDLYASLNTLMTGGVVSTFAVDQSSGHLATAAPNVDTSNGRPGKLVMDPTGKFVYAALIPRHEVDDPGGWELLLRDPATGALTDTTKMYNTTHYPTVYNDGVFAHGGKYLIGVSAPYDLSSFAVDASSGALTVASDARGDYNGVAVDRTGKYVVVSRQSGAVESYVVNGDGSLTKVGSAMAAAGVTYVAFDTTNKYVYVTNQNTSQVFGFSFDPATGALAAVSGSPFATSEAPLHLTTAGK